MIEYIWNAYQKQKDMQDTDRLIRPIYSPLLKNGIKQRFSEQELKQNFIHVLSKSIKIKGNGWSYSVETPSIDGYIFKDSDYPKIASRNEGGQSARFDCTIYSQHNGNTYKILSHIEFKEGAADDKEITKDLLKLANEPFCHHLNEDERKTVSEYYIGDLKQKDQYFIHLSEKLDKTSLLSLTCKYFGLNNKTYERLDREDYKSVYHCLEKSKNKIYIYVIVQDCALGIDAHDESSLNSQNNTQNSQNNTQEDNSRDKFVCFRINYRKYLQALEDNQPINLNNVWERVDKEKDVKEEANEEKAD